MSKNHRRVLLVLALIIPLLIPGISYAQSTIQITLVEPTEGAVISGALTVRGTATVPPEKQLTLQVTATDTGAVLATTTLSVTGTVGQQGTFSISANFVVNADTPILIQVMYVKNNRALASAQVHVTLHNGNLDPAGMGALTLALGEYEARVQTVVPMPVSIEDHAYSDNCLGLARPGEQCTSAQINGKLVKLAEGGDAYVYRIDPAGPQARLDVAQSTPLKQTNSVPKVLADATAATGVKLYLPLRFHGPFTNLPLAHVDWQDNIVVLTYSADGNPVSFTVSEKAMTPNATLPTGGGDTISLGGVNVPVQTIEDRRVVVWVIQGAPGTIVTLNVPGNITTSALTDLAQGFAALGSTDPGQTNPYNRTAFDKLTLALPEPIRSVEMARQALMSLIKSTRKGGVIAFQQRNFPDTCLQLPRTGEQTCQPTTTPGYVIGIADTELFRYHVSGAMIRLNHDNSDLIDKLSVDYNSLDAVKAAVKFPVVTPGDAAMVFLGAKIGMLNNTPSALLIYRDPKSGGFFSLLETASSTAVPTNTAKNAAGNTATFSVQQPDNNFTAVALWATPEVDLTDLSRFGGSAPAQG